MIADIDIIIPLGILLAMLLSNEPKKSAIAVIIFISLSIIAIDYFVTGWITLYLASIIESSGAIGLIIAARYLAEFKDRIFFRLMGLLLLLSSGVAGAFIFGYTAHSNYVFISEVVAVIHLITMLSLSDGIRNFAGNMRDSLITSRGGFTNS